MTRLSAAPHAVLKRRVKELTKQGYTFEFTAPIERAAQTLEDLARYRDGGEEAYLTVLGDNRRLRAALTNLGQVFNEVSSTALPPARRTQLQGQAQRALTAIPTPEKGTPILALRLEPGETEPEFKDRALQAIEKFFERMTAQGGGDAERH